MNNIERYIYELYKSIQISHPDQLKIQDIANKLGISVFYGSVNLRFNNVIVLKKSNPQIEWQNFGHELCHCLRHVGNQLNMHYLFVELQEYQANHFAYHFCVPTFMLQQLREVTIYEVMNLFNVEYDFAYTRLEMYQNKILSKGVLI